MDGKWVFKTKKTQKATLRDIKQNSWPNDSLRGKEFDYTKTFSLVSNKDSLRVTMDLVAHFDLELHHMDVKNAFFNDGLEEEVYMKQPEGFSSSANEHLVCKLNKSIYGLKQAS